MGYFFILRNYKIPKTKNITNFSGVLGAAAPKGLGRSPYKICELDLSSLKANKNQEFLRINLEFLKDCFASLAMTRILEFLGQKSRIP